jgi:hypothetical protein
MQPPREDEGGRLAVDEVDDRATLQRELIAAGEDDDGRKASLPT